jgi:hypothetical protein
MDRLHKHCETSAGRPILWGMGARRNRNSFNLADRFFAGVKLNIARQRAADLRKERKRALARVAERKAKALDRDMEMFEREHRLSQVLKQRDEAAWEELRLVEVGKMTEARAAAAEAERWDREAKRLRRMR